MNYFEQIPVQNIDFIYKNFLRYSEEFNYVPMFYEMYSHNTNNIYYKKDYSANRTLYLYFLYSYYSNITKLNNCFKNNTILIPILRIFKTIKKEHHKTFFYFLIERIQDICQFIFIKIFKLKYEKYSKKSFYFKIDNSIYDALVYIYENYFSSEDSNYEFVSLNNFNFDNNISYYYSSYKNLYDVYLKDKEFEKIEKSVRPLSYPLWTLSKY